MQPADDIREEPEPSLAEAVAARVAEILEAAERDAREALASVRRPGVTQREPTGALTMDELAQALDLVMRRLAALERRLVELEASGGPATAAELEPEQAPEPEPAIRIRAAEIRAIDLALAGYDRDEIAHELAASMPADEVHSLLDEVLED